MGTSTRLRGEYRCGCVQRDERIAGPVLDLAGMRPPEAHLLEGGRMLCVDGAAFRAEFEAKQNVLGVRSHSFAYEQLEDALLRLIRGGEGAWGVGPSIARSLGHG